MLTEQKVKKVICDCLCIESITDNSIALIKLGADSLDFLNLEFHLKEAFDDKLTGEMNVGEQTTVQDVIDFVEAELK